MKLRNYCLRCGDILVDEVEFRYGYCLWDLTILLEKLDEAVTDLWFDGYDDGAI